jgi:hypothetical protein
MKPYTIMRNKQIVSLVERLDQYTYEVYKSASTAVDNWSSFDLERLRTYLDNADKLVAYMVSAAPGEQIDAPETSPMQYNMHLLTLNGQPKLGADNPGPIDLMTIENKDIRDVLQMLIELMMALSNCQSAAYINGLISHDKRRYDLRMKQMRDFLDTFVVTTDPKDLPETHPSTGTSGTGQGF